MRGCDQWGKGIHGDFLDTGPNTHIRVVDACERGCILMEDRDTHRYLLDTHVLVGMDGERKKRTVLANSGDRLRKAQVLALRTLFIVLVDLHKICLLVLFCLI